MREQEGKNILKPAFKLYAHSCNLSQLGRGKFSRDGIGICNIKTAKLASVTKQLD
jgi:hypothetical protein